MLAVEFLIAVIGNDGCLHFVGNCQYKCISSTNGPSRWGDELIVVHGIIEVGNFFLVDAMTKTGIDNHRNF